MNDNDTEHEIELLTKHLKQIPDEVLQLIEAYWINSVCDPQIIKNYHSTCKILHTRYTLDVAYHTRILTERITQCQSLRMSLPHNTHLKKLVIMYTVYEIGRKMYILLRSTRRKIYWLPALLPNEMILKYADEQKINWFEHEFTLHLALYVERCYKFTLKCYDKQTAYCRDHIHRNLSSCPICAEDCVPEVEYRYQNRHGAILQWTEPDVVVDK